MIRLGLLISVVMMVSFCSNKTTGSSKVIASQIPQDKSWKFETTPTWQDEFNDTGLPDTLRWGYDLGGSGWGNNEAQYYTNVIANAKVDNGKLTIVARKENTGGKNYTSARLVTKNKGDFLYGRIEVRAKLPAGRGTWPAIWMLPTDWAYGGWPKSGEIDIMEHVGYDPNKVLSSVHTESYYHSIGTQKSGGLTIPTAMSDFHNYRVDWTTDFIKAYYDEQLVFTFINEGKGYASWPFDKRFHIILNLAVGGNWGGAKGIDDNIFPASFEIDYVRVYKMIK